MSVTKLLPPQATGKGAGKALGNMSLAEINGEASSAYNPHMHTLKESDPVAQEMLRKNHERIRQLQGKSTASNDFRRGDKVYHRARRQNYTVVAQKTQELIEVQASGHKNTVIVRKDNLERR